MESFLASLLLVCALSFGARDQLIIAQFADSLERTAPLLVTAALSAILSACVIGYAGSVIGQNISDETARWLALAALLLGAGMLSRQVHMRPMIEPTRSYVAIGAVLFARQLADPARLALFAVSLVMEAPQAAIAGGAIGGMLASALGWIAGLAKLERLPLRPVRWLFALGMIVSALLIGLNVYITNP